MPPFQELKTNEINHNNTLKIKCNTSSMVVLLKGRFKLHNIPILLGKTNVPVFSLLTLNIFYTFF